MPDVGNAIERIFTKAAARQSSVMDKASAVPPRVLKGVLSEGPFVEDELTAEYLGGVLASSRTSIARDDRAATLISLVARMSTYQLRAHYVMYATARRAFAGLEDFNIAVESERNNRPLFLSWDGVWAAWDLDDQEQSIAGDIINHVISGLIRENLIEDQYTSGPAEYLRLHGAAGRKDFGAGGVIYRIHPIGVELFCAAHGIRREVLTSFLDPTVAFEIEPTITLSAELGLAASLPDLADDE